MKKFLSFGLFLTGVGVGYIGKDMTSVLTNHQYYTTIEVPFTDRDVEVSIMPAPQPILVKPLLMPMLTPEDTKQGPPQGPPEINWEVELLDGVKYFEGYRSRAYTCSGGVRTIGYGCTDRRVVSRGTISKERATTELKKELDDAEQIVKSIVKVKLNEHQLAALTSFTFNCGPSNLKRLVTGSGRLNKGNYDSVASLLAQYRIAGGKVRKGLEKRRAWEISVWKGDPLDFQS
jgi:lysozyme